MRNSGRFRGLMLALLGVMVLFANLSKPRVEALHGADVLGFVASGVCFSVAFVGLIGKLKVRSD